MINTLLQSSPARTVPHQQPSAQASSNVELIAEQALDGSPRRVGVEFEFCNLPVDAAARAVHTVFGGEISQSDRHAASVQTPDFGQFKIALDARAFEAKASDTPLLAQAREMAGDVASLIVPVEVTCPPVPVYKLDAIDRLASALREHGASGTSRSMVYAFGLHLNIEEQHPSPDTILSTLQAFILLEDWLRAEIDVDKTRSALAFEAPFGAAYQELVLSADYAPSGSELIDDYIAHNPTRNRALDLLPILSFLQPDRVEIALPEEKIGRRPAYHYRLANSEIDDPHWEVAQEWRRWLVVERLAARPERLAIARSDRLTLLKTPAPDHGQSALREASLRLGDVLAGGAS